MFLLRHNPTLFFFFFFFLNDPPPTDISSLPLHAPLPIYPRRYAARFGRYPKLAKPSALLRHRSRERSEEHTSELQSPDHLVCRLLLEKKKKKKQCML